MMQSYRVDRRVDVRTPMRDGVELSTDLFIPRDAGRCPTVLIRTPLGLFMGNGPTPVASGLL